MLPQLPAAGRLPDPSNVVAGAHHRITLLDAGLVRLEYSESGVFEDRPSQVAIDRSAAPVEHTVHETDDLLEVRTSRLWVSYDKRPFSAEGLMVQIAGGGSAHTGKLWRFGDTLPNLGGTARTLDEVDGACPLEPGLLSRLGLSVLDDSNTVLLREDGWIAPRTPGNRDLYVFGYGSDHAAALRAFYRLTGPQPLLPRYALGNWWSRYHPYTAEEYVALLDRFDAERIPLSVAVLDMDWHLVDIDPKYGSGWTGYTWNTELFPDPPAFLAELHRRGLRVSLNVHPAEGVHAHEAAYAELAERVGIDPATEQPIPFDPTDPQFLRAYLDVLHHPLERDGVDLWWLDWQQGVVTRIPGLDPLWLLNHFHYLDSARDGRRPMTFSRYAGPGSHRYPIGFSGDTVSSWASLDFQPYFTATAANIGYGWWSHDIGGHFGGSKDDELIARWVQLGVFSPIMRLHSTLSPFNTKEPWRFGLSTHRIMAQFLRIRHRLVPYLYTMNRRAHEDGVPLVRPLYHEYPDTTEAYAHRTTYLFGDRLLVAPITSPRDRSTLLGAVTAWLPPGEWIDVFSGLAYRGGRTIVLHRPVDSLPVLARAGAIVPLVADDALDAGTANPAALDVHVYAGASGEFVLSEDDDDANWTTTRISFADNEIRIDAADGDSAPALRRWALVLCGFGHVSGVGVSIDGGIGEHVEVGPGAPAGTVRIELGEISTSVPVVVRLDGDLSLRANRDTHERIFALLDAAQAEFAHKEQVLAVIDRDADLGATVAQLTALDLPRPLFTAVVELLTAY